MENISYFDLIVAILLIIFGLKGFARGFIKEIFGLIGIIGGIFIASRYADYVGNFIDTHLHQIENKASIYFIGFFISFLLFWIVSIILGIIITKLLNLSGLSLINRIFGFLSGSLKIFLLFSVVIFALRSIDIFKENVDKKLKNSYLYASLIKSGEYIVKFKDNKNRDLNSTVSNNLDKNNTKL